MNPDYQNDAAVLNSTYDEPKLIHSTDTSEETINVNSSYNVSVFLGIKLHSDIELTVLSILPEFNRLKTEKASC